MFENTYTFMVVTVAERIDVAWSRFHLFLEVLGVRQTDVYFAWSFWGLGYHWVVHQSTCWRRNASRRRNGHEFGRVRI